LGWFQAVRLLYRFNVIALNETLGRRRRP
jgi:hypothetical protein